MAYSVSQRMEERPPTGWVLRSLIAGGDRVWNVAVITLPFRVGRKPGLELTLPSTAVSTNHAELYEADGQLRVRDMGSTNGTYVNRRKVTDEAVRDGDVLHFADFEFRLESTSPTNPTTAVLRHFALPEQFVKGTRELEELVRDRAISTHFQPIVSLPGGVTIAHEALGRGTHPGLSPGPQELLHLADRLGRSVALSRLFREQAVETARRQAAEVRRLFLNTHPREISEPGLTESLRGLRESVPDLPLTVEVHESAIVGSESIRLFRASLREMGIDLAYDDFGAGQARLLELAEVPPEYLKFDIRFVQGIAIAPESKQRMVRSLVSIARDLGVRTIAEGVETEPDARMCVELGFDLAQGYYFGVPSPLPPLS